MRKTYWTYIITNEYKTTLYIGITSDLEHRIDQHHAGTFEGFSKTYNLKYLVHYESFTEVKDAIRREKQLKKWNRAWKIQLIEENNPKWEDLSDNGNWFKYS
jgi:putative endonuclease